MSLNNMQLEAVSAKRLLKLIKLVLAAVFLLSSVPKLRNSYSFLENVVGYGIVGPKAALFVAIVLPWLELLIALNLFMGVLVSGSLITACFLAIVFSTSNIWAVVHGLHISCGCFGSGSLTPISWANVMISIIVGVVAAAGLIIDFKSRLPGKSEERSLPNIIDRA